MLKWQQMCAVLAPPHQRNCWQDVTTRHSHSISTEHLTITISAASGADRSRADAATEHLGRAPLRLPKLDNTMCYDVCIIIIIFLLE